MPILKIDHIISFSSEDPVHVANNILSSDSKKKWLCRKAGEVKAVIVMQLEKASVITGVDIGNEHSAFVEVLVTRSEATDDYKVLLTMCSFMTPIESRQSKNANQVRMFSKNDLSKPECDEKWDRVKIVCTQPFNKHVQYGLNFVTLLTSDSKVDSTPVQSNIGKFTLRPESPNNLSLSSLFSKRKDAQQEEKLTGAAAIREASTPSSLSVYGSPVCKPKLKNQNNPLTTPSQSSHTSKKENGSSETPKPRNKMELFYSKDELLELEKEKATNAKGKIGEKNTKETKALAGKRNDRSPANKRTSLDNSVNDASMKETQKRKTRDYSQENIKQKKAKQIKPSKPFNKLLEGVNLVISGIMNPDRGNLRSMALAMGAKYKPDWDNSCTHLICAFSNTPKYNQVKGKGKIIKRTWIEECHSQRKRLPWRRFALDKNDQKKNESEDEIVEEVSTQNIENDEDNFDEHTEEASDTEERLLKASLPSTSKKEPNKTHDIDDIYTMDTDIEEDCSDDISSSADVHFKSIFENKSFYIDQSYDVIQYAQLNRYILAYKGIVYHDTLQEPDFIVTTRENSTKLKKHHPVIGCISSNWIWQCHNEQKYLDPDEYLY